MSRRLPLAAALAATAVVAIVGVTAVLSARDGERPAATRPATTGGPSGSSSPASARPSGHLLPATSRFPAVGACGQTDGDLLTVQIGPDTPNPRCASVDATQRLRVVNRTGDYGAPAHTVTVVWMPGRPFTLRPGESRTFPRQFGTYLARGVHDLKAGPGYRSEIWLR